MHSMALTWARMTHNKAMIQEKKIRFTSLERLERQLQAISADRAQGDAHPGSSLADLYDAVAMPPDLAKAHEGLDRAVLMAYGLKPVATDAEVLGELFMRYEALVAPMAGIMGNRRKKGS